MSEAEPIYLPDHLRAERDWRITHKQAEMLVGSKLHLAFIDQAKVWRSDNTQVALSAEVVTHSVQYIPEFVRDHLLLASAIVRPHGERGESKSPTLSLVLETPYAPIYRLYPHQKTTQDSLAYVVTTEGNNLVFSRQTRRRHFGLEKRSKTMLRDEVTTLDTTHMSPLDVRLGLTLLFFK